MEKLTDKIAALPQGANYFSLEFFPPKTQMVGCPALIFEKTELTIWRLGLCESPGSAGAYGTFLATAVRHRHMGRWGKYGIEIAGTRRDLSASIEPHDMSALDMHEYEPGPGRRSAGGGEGLGHPEHLGAAG